MKRLRACLLFVGLAACGVELEVPRDADLICETNDECPSGTRCHPQLGRCVSTTSDDAVAPNIDPASITIEPARASQNSAVFISFSVDEDLAAAPTLALVDPQGLASPIVDANIITLREDRRSYIYVFRPRGTEREIRWSIVANLYDQVGNGTENSVIGNVDLDFTPPDLTASPTASRAFIAAGASVLVSIQANEKLAATPQAFLSFADGTTPRLMRAGVHNPTLNRYQFEYTALGDEPPGRAALLLPMTDAAGNFVTREKQLELTLDFAPPSIVSVDAVAIDPPPGAPLNVARHVTHGSTYAVRFVASEELAQPPVVRAIKGSTTLTLEESGTVSGVYRYAITLADDATYDQGIYTLQATLVDLGGNEHVETLVVDLPLVVDTEAPAPPAVNVSDLVVHTRSPWGRDVTQGEPRFTMRGGAGAVASCSPNAPVPAGDACHVVVAYASAVTAATSELGRADVTVDGGFAEVNLAEVDVPVLYVAAVDAAGNVSDANGNAADGAQAIAVRDAVWIATLSGKVENSTVANPHTVVTTPSFRATLAQDEVRALEPVVDPPVGVRLRGADGVTLSAASERIWSQRFPTTLKPEARTEHATAYDLKRGRTIMFGGQDDAGKLQDVWEWDGTRWDFVIVGGESPSPRAGHAMAYDAARGVTVMFGGLTVEGTLSDETWIWNGNAWRKATPALSPPGREFHRMTYFPERGTVILFGGLSANELDDVWEWDGETWAPVVSGGALPPARWNHAMAYDPIRGRIVIYGGRATSPRADMWSWDGTTWDEEIFFGSRPSPLFVNRMAYDFMRERLVLFGEKTWEWTGTQWIAPNTASTITPDSRSFGEMEFDPVRKRVTLFGGKATAVCTGSVTELCGDVWEWGGSVWSEATPGDASVPEPRDKHAMAYDEESLRAIMFGGSNGPIHPGTWAWTGSNWLDVTPVVEPPIRIRHAMAYDATALGVVMFGGIKGSTFCDGEVNTCGDTWLFSAGFWDKVLDAVGAPPARHSHAMAYVTASTPPGVVMFGGSRGQASATTRCPLVSGTKDCADTWRYDSVTNTWSDESGLGADQPSARTRHAMAYDRTRGVAVLFGGLDASSECRGDDMGAGRACDDTWEWGQWGIPVCITDDAFCWREVTPVGSPSPTPRSSHAMTYDVARQRVVLYGGQLADGEELGDTWEWTGSRWIEITPSRLNPPARFAHTLAYDVARRQAVLFGGSSRRDTWELAADPDQRPALIASIDWRFASADIADVEGLTIVAHASGTGFVTAAVDTPLDGARLLVWQPERNGWVNSASTGAGVDGAPGVIDYTTASPQESQSVFADDSLVHFALTPTFPMGNGSTPAEVKLDYLEVAVKYRRDP
ncbi:MAG: hypothetical protein ACAI38_02865 [Myxococcota bacterium]